MATLVDTNVLIDVFHTRSAFTEWSTEQLAAAQTNGPLLINPLIYAEMAAGYATSEELESALAPSLFRREDLPWQAAYAAGHAFLQYRRLGGDKRSPLPDFYIGAHAMVKGYRLLSRDVARYRTYFPLISLISPETHP
ncbi:type II toxin-antitoxin system VapC family toxin [Neorhizobium galegae]|uniref:type II toxin-antitoxin system VapC family toxin n=1 Tax=Neorhizobium galegae TaxID=399 RepID=UPI000621FAE0|nr:type II toxin-antitoxin system VapC family toxin [Neorhizobium galegae]CDZ28396.1 Putative nucleic acid-binding protein [Neorhizobium galegae bv. officinalis]CDZ57433.1 Putative nucleic acid-binding protein [Neorhizobium galegae bv. orientalis]KAA9388168.1 type II toxin-antitoxin system VapC family toxin [Neorhizobium galegae]KAB1115372.1 type II toxin-antitoxin system VapC family toxin [Neorhizobium galegae]KAB1124254.1 type II toxin-antitoxin system VapC family toxin [Neorhizobium galegae